MKISADYRMLALDALRGKWKTAVLTGIAASALGATIVSSSNSAVSNSNQAKDIHFELFSQPNGGRLLAVLLAGIVLHPPYNLPGKTYHRCRSACEHIHHREIHPRSGHGVCIGGTAPKPP